MDLLHSLRKLHGAIYEKTHYKSNRKKQIENVLLMQKTCPVRVLDIDGTLDELNKGKSMTRFGDGEMEIILGGEIGFQKKNLELGDRLKRILLDEQDEKIIICVPDALVTLDNLTEESIDHWVQNMTQHFNDWMKYLKTDYSYGTTNVTRCYMRYADKTNSLRWFKRLQDLWTNQDVVLIEGYETRVGVGNDMLDNTKSTRRVLCPSENAYDKYDEIYSYIVENISKDSLILLALGPTATLLSWELSKIGYRTLDIGHCDIEYSWCKLGVKEKIAVDGKYTNEVTGGNQVRQLVDEKYFSEIITKI